MQIIVSGRNVEIAESLRAHIDEQFRRLTRFDPKISKVEVTLTEEKNRSIVEAHLSVDGAAPIHGRAEMADFRSALDRLVDKLSRQVKKKHSRRKEHKAPAELPVMPSQPLAGEEGGA